MADDVAFARLLPRIAFLSLFQSSMPVREAAALAALRAAVEGTLPRDLEDVLHSASSAADPLLDAPRAAFEAAIRAGQHNEEPARQADLVRCVLGNPFRPTRLSPAWLAANDGAARRVAQGIHDGRAFA